MENKKWFWVFISCLFVVLIMALGFIVFQYFDLFFGGNREIQKEDITKEECPDCVRRNLDGIYVEKTQENLYPVAVIIENMPEARPQSGLSLASLVYEAEAEGSITRFLAFYSDIENVEEIGPVRSARPYFVDWLNPLSALFVHVGGSPEALVKIKKENIFNLNEFYNGNYFYRSEDKQAPHNVYIFGQDINYYLENQGREGGTFFPWIFKDDAILNERGDVLSVDIPFILKGFKVSWKYDIESNDYLRYMGDEIHYDKLDDREIRAKNIIIEYVDAEVIDDKLRLEMQHIGDGEALLCQDGICQDGTWEKKSETSRTRFYVDGEEFKFNAGTTWVEVVRPEIEVSITKE